MAQQQQPYYGPIGMAASRYANPQRREEVAALLASNPALKEKTNAENILGSREKKDNGNNAERDQNDAFRFAQAQSQAIQDEVVRHTKDVERTVSTVKTAIRQILNQIRETISREVPETAAETLRTVDGLWIELEKLLEATRKAKEATPHFVEKCKENTGILIAAKIQETQDDCQRELDRKDKRAGLLHEQNAGQIQAFKDVEANYNHKNAELQEKYSRAKLENGLLREELEAKNSQLAVLQKSQDNAVKMAENSQKQVEELKESKKTLTAEIENLRAALTEADAKSKASNEKATGDLENELRRVAELLQKEQEKSSDLTATLTAARQAEDLATKEVAKAKTECDLLSDKYQSQSGFFKKMTEDLKSQTQKMITLEDELSKLQKENTEAGKEHERVVSSKDTLQNQYNALKSELDNLKKETEDAKDKSERLSKSLEQVMKEQDKVEAENRDLRTKLVQREDDVATQKKTGSEIATLRATIQNMKTVSPTADVSFEQSMNAKAVEELKNKLSESEKERAQWEELGRKLMAKFRDQREKEGGNGDLEKRLEIARAENAQLQLTVNELKSGANSKEKYWQNQYNKLLASLDN